MIEDTQAANSGGAHLVAKLGVDEIQTVEGMLGVLDPAIHVRPAIPAGITLDGRALIDDLQFFRT